MHACIRFDSAPTHIKKILFKTLIRPVLEYPVVINKDLNITAQRKLQAVQNHSLRFIIKGIRQSDRFPVKKLHDDLNIPPLNVRLSQWANKSINTMKNNYIIPKNQDRFTVYKFSDYTIETAATPPYPT